MESAPDTNQIKHHPLANTNASLPVDDSKEPTYTAPKGFSVISTFQATTIRWKAQFLSHVLYGLWLGTLAVYSWNVGVPTVLSVTFVYILLYIFIYFPLMLIEPYFNLYPVLKAINNLKRGLAVGENHMIEFVSFISKLPIRSALITLPITMSAFVCGIIVWRSGIIPGLIPVKALVTAETILLGIVLAISEGLVNFAMFDRKSIIAIEQILDQFPSLQAKLNIKRKTSYYKKIFTLLILITFAGELSVIHFFTTYLASEAPEKLAINLAFIIIVIILTFIYLAIVTPHLARSFSLPINKLVSWSKEVSQGNLSKRIHLVTNDETAELITQVNGMMDNLQLTTIKLQESKNIVEQNLKTISLERNKLAAILSGIGDGVVVVDPSYRIKLLNGASEYILQTKQENVENLHIDIVLKMHDEDDQIVKISDYLNPMLTDTNLKPTLKYTLKDKSVKYINLNRVTKLAGESSDLIITIHDITHERELEEMKLDFVSIAAHELRTPLTAIIGYLSVMKQSMESGDQSNNNLFMDRITNSSHQLRTLVENLLNVSKVERRDMLLAVAPVNVPTLAQQIVDELKITAHDHKLALTYLEPKRPIDIIEGDPDRLREVMVNLIANAINYTQPGGVVTVWVEQNGNLVTTNIQDTGVGIPQEAIPHLFTKFFRVSGSLQSGAKGTGLGLYLSKAIVEMHHGTINVVSKIGAGSTFSFTLPVNQKDNVKRI